MYKTSRYHDALHTASRLPVHILRSFYLAAALAGTSATLFALTHVPAHAGAVVAPASAQPTNLPKVSVHAQPPVVTLATVTVRASDAFAGSADGQADATVHALHAPNARSSLVSRRAKAVLAMPYYSFATPARMQVGE